MLTTWAKTQSGIEAVPVEACSLPAWVSRLLSGAPEVLVRKSAGRPAAAMYMARFNGLTLLRVVVPEADSLSALDFQRSIVAAYGEIRVQLAAVGASPLRFWNIIPQIRARYADGLDRYMVFNAGRFAAYTDWHGPAEAFDGELATATAIGHHGPHLQIAVLAGPKGGIPVENTRQRRAYQYSSKYGPMPPCFSRGALCPPHEGLPQFIIGGTSSVCGERSLHLGDVVAQTKETLCNIAALLEAAAGEAGSRRAVNAEPLWCIESLRIYLVDEGDADSVLPLVAAEVNGLSAPVEIVRADICRPELLVEIEGTAHLDKEHVGR